MGPGLFFALLGLTLLGTPARAEQAVGLEAEGVSPLAALHNPQDLDVRDALGRPVSAALVASQLRQAQAKAASEAAFASTLPKAAAMAALLEMIEALRLALRGGTAGLPPMRLFALAPSTRTADRSAASLIVILGIALLSGAAAMRPAATVPICRSRRSSVMRC